MQLDPQLKSLADILVGISVRELRSANVEIKIAGLTSRRSPEFISAYEKAIGIEVAE